MSVPGAFHEILMETDDVRNIFLRILRRVGRPGCAPTRDRANGDLGTDL